MTLRSDLADAVRAALERHRVPGLALALVTADGSIQLAGFGVRRVGKAATVNGNTVFAAASLTKPVFALGALRLWADEGLDLDAPLTRYMRQLVVPDDARSRQITARMVLSHTTGLPNWSRHDPPLRFHFDPGTRWGYSGEGYMHLQTVVEHVTGCDLETYMKEAVFEPLGMKSTSLIWRDAFRTRFAPGYNKSNEVEPLWSPDSAMAAGSLLTTASDYSKFLRTLLLRTGDPVVQQMLTRTVTIDNALGWGLGIGNEETSSGSAWWQWGNDPGYEAFVLLAGSQAVVAFTNGDRGASVYPQVIRDVLKRNHPCLALSRRSAWKEFWTRWS
jgi:CubicO group peptidase (beta-lactamase class C family)